MLFQANPNISFGFTFINTNVFRCKNKYHNNNLQIICRFFYNIAKKKINFVEECQENNRNIPKLLLILYLETNSSSL